MGCELSSESLRRLRLRTGCAGILQAAAGTLRRVPGSVIFGGAGRLAVVRNDGQGPDFSAGPFVVPASP